MADDDIRELALDAALRLAEACPCHTCCKNATEDLLHNADDILAWLLRDRPAELVMVVGPVTEQT